MKKKTEQIEALQLAANSPKSALMRIEDQMAEISPKKAAALNKIICRLEDWQNRP